MRKLRFHEGTRSGVHRAALPDAAAPWHLVILHHVQSPEAMSMVSVPHFGNSPTLPCSVMSADLGETVCCYKAALMTRWGCGPKERLAAWAGGMEGEEEGVEPGGLRDRAARGRCFWVPAKRAPGFCFVRLFFHILLFFMTCLPPHHLCVGICLLGSWIEDKLDMRIIIVQTHIRVYCSCSQSKWIKKRKKNRVKK